MEQGYSSADVSTVLPVSYKWTRNGMDVVIYDIRINGLESMYGLLPDSVKLAIMDRLAANVRGVD